MAVHLRAAIHKFVVFVRIRLLKPSKKLPAIRMQFQPVSPLSQSQSITTIAFSAIPHAIVQGICRRIYRDVLVRAAIADADIELRRWEDALERGLLSLEDAAQRMRDVQQEKTLLKTQDKLGRLGLKPKYAPSRALLWTLMSRRCKSG